MGNASFAGLGRGLWLLVASLGLGGACDDGEASRPSDTLADGQDAGEGDDDGAETDDGGGGPDDDGGPAPDEGDEDDADDDADGGDDDADAGDTGGGNDDGGDGSDTDGDDDGPSVQCTGQTSSLIANGWVDASSTFEGFFSSYPADLAIDGNTSTSWFSAGSEVDGVVSTFEFILMQDHCIDTIAIEGNAFHAEESFREGFGYQAVTVEILNTANETVYEEEFPMEGTPDPALEVDAGGVLGHRVVLHWAGHESPECGGFSELVVAGRAQR